MATSPPAASKAMRMDSFMGRGLAFLTGLVQPRQQVAAGSMLLARQTLDAAFVGQKVGRL